MPLMSWDNATKSKVPAIDTFTGLEFKKQDTVDLTMKEINGMMNKNGGFVVNGIKDSKNSKSGKPEIVGINNEIKSSNNDIENYKNSIVSWLEIRFDRFALELVDFDIVNDSELTDGKNVLVFDVKASKELAIPMKANGPIEKKKSRNKPQIFIRSGVSTRELIGYDERRKWETLRFS